MKIKVKSIVNDLNNIHLANGLYYTKSSLL